MISFYTDENVGLRRRGVDVLTAQEAGLRGTIPDVQHLEFAIARARTLLTADTDLLAMPTSGTRKVGHTRAWFSTISAGRQSATLCGKPTASRTVSILTT